MDACARLAIAELAVSMKTVTMRHRRGAMGVGGGWGEGRGWDEGFGFDNIV